MSLANYQRAGSLKSDKAGTVMDVKTPTTSDQIIQAIRAAASNAGTPPGERVFLQISGLSRSDLWKAGFARYSEALAAAGFAKNSMNAAMNSEYMLDSLEKLVARLGRFPTKGDIKVARKTDSTFPSYESLFRLSGRSFPRLRSVLLEHCRTRECSPAVLAVLEDPARRLEEQGSSDSYRRQRVNGYVYLLRHGDDYKIGRSNDVARRRREFALLLPQELEHVHVIETDDPEGIEYYWHRRFQTRRTRGEWFRLTRDDVAAFRRRKYQ